MCQSEQRARSPPSWQSNICAVRTFAERMDAALLKSEIRRPKEGRNPKSEKTNHEWSLRGAAAAKGQQMLKGQKRKKSHPVLPDKIFAKRNDF
jgi:hypothetical protein